MTFVNKILRLTNSERIHLSEDLRQMIEEENNVKWIFLALSFCSELLFETKSMRSRRDMTRDVIADWLHEKFRKKDFCREERFLNVF
jgi:hypothetical protein